MCTTYRVAVVVLLGAIAASAVGAQTVRPTDTTPALLRGTVTTSGGAPVDGANVFLLESLEGTIADAQGNFIIRTSQRGAATLVARRVGFTPARLAVTLPREAPVTLVLVHDAAQFAPITVEAGRYTAGDERGATLTTLEVVTTPGAAANVNRAIQTLPGVQAVDEGTGLYVRGGDYTETRVLLDGAALFNGTQLLSPSGTFTGTVDPFLLDGIFFSSGGFGARYGDALSGVASLRTQGRAPRSSATVSAGLAAVSAAGALALPHGLGVRVAANRSDLAPFLRVNGSPRPYAPAPGGHDLSGSVAWDYRPTGGVKVFSIDQRTRLGLGVDEASFAGSYDLRVDGGATILSWHDVLAGVAPTLSVSTSRLDRAEGFGAYRLRSRQRSDQLALSAERAVTGRLTARAGVDWERRGSRYDGSVPQAGYDVGPDARTTVWASDRASSRTGAFAEADWRLSESTRLTTGLRGDRSALTGVRTADPRVSLAVQPLAALALTAAWGVYHQVPDPLFFDPEFGVPSLAPMRATQAVLGAQLGDEGKATARVEVYDKRYRDLAQLSRDNAVVGGGTGRSRGLDAWIKGRGPFGTSGRVSYSYVSARRTDPVGGRDARAPFDVPHSLTAMLERDWRQRWKTSVAYRLASGRPFTPVAGATYDAARKLWVPTYAAAMSERYPTFKRLDVSASYVRRFGPSMQGVVFWSWSNVLDRENVYAYRYSADYGRRFAVPSLFNRSHYFGFSLTRL